jgi:hypothetical protein
MSTASGGAILVDSSFTLDANASPIPHFAGQRKRSSAFVMADTMSAKRDRRGRRQSKDGEIDH